MMFKRRILITHQIVRVRGSCQENFWNPIIKFSYLQKDIKNKTRKHNFQPPVYHTIFSTMIPHGDDKMQIIFHGLPTEPDQAQVSANFSTQSFNKHQSCTESFSIHSLFHFRDSSMSKLRSAKRKKKYGDTTHRKDQDLDTSVFSSQLKKKSQKTTRKIFTTFTCMY